MSPELKGLGLLRKNCYHMCSATAVVVDLSIDCQSDYYRSIFVTLILTSGVPDPDFKNKKIYFHLAAVYHKNCTENICLIEQFEH